MFAKQLDEPPHDITMLELGNLAIGIILARTKKGLDADGAPFRPYTAAYAKRRQDKQLRRTPDLAVTGHMLQALMPQVRRPGTVTVGFLSQAEQDKAQWNTNMGREFVDIQRREEIDVIGEQLGEKYAAQIEMSVK